MSDTPFMAQRRKLKDLKGKQDAGQAPTPNPVASKPVESKKKAKKKTSG